MSSGAIQKFQSAFARSPNATETMQFSISLFIKKIRAVRYEWATNERQALLRRRILVKDATGRLPGEKS